MSFRPRILRSFKSRLAIVAGVALLASAIAMPATTALASGQTCNESSLTTCVYVEGSGLYVDYAQGWATDNTAFTYNNLHIEIEGPAGLLQNCGTFSLSYGQTSPSCFWERNGDVEAGNYCATLWYYTNGEYYNMGTPCVDVHS